MRRAILIFSCLLLIVTAVQKWPLAAYELEMTSTSMPPIINIEAENLTCSNTRIHTFFHSHRAGELGHFHIFFTDEDQSLLHHIVGASLNENGELIKLFVTAPWVTNDDYLPVQEVMEYIADLSDNTWIEQLLKKHALTIEQLHILKNQIKKPLIGRYSIIAEQALQPFPHVLSEEIDQMGTHLK